MLNKNNQVKTTASNKNQVASEPKLIIMQTSSYTNNQTKLENANNS